MTGKEIQRLSDFENDWDTVHISMDPWWADLVSRLDRIRTERRYYYRSVNWSDVRDHGAKHLVICGRCVDGDHSDCLNRERCDCDVCVREVP